MKKKVFFLKRQTLFRWSHVYMGMIGFFSLIIFLLNWKLGILAFMIFVTLIIIHINHIIQYRNSMTEYLKNLHGTIHSAENNMLLTFPFPYAILDMEGRIQWYNPKFESLVSQKQIFHREIGHILPEFDVVHFPTEPDEIWVKHFEYNERHYKAFTQRMLQADEEEKESLYILYLLDETQNIELKAQKIRQQTLVSLIYIDNYEEVMQSLEEVRRPLLVALIDRKLNALAGEVEGIIKKFERDKYLLLFPHQHLKLLEERRFEILDIVREIHIGNDLPVTLSIGIGVKGKDLPQSMDYARAAIDLALGRGGDQAVIKNTDKYSFYGGKTKEVEKSTRVKARIKAYALKELIEESERVLIMGHKGPDVDSLGAAMGVYRGATLLNKKAHIVLNETTTSIQALYDKLKESQDYEEDLFVSSVQAIGLSGEKTLLIIVDVNRPSYVECPELLELSKNIVVFDHHRTSVEFIQNAVLSYVEPYASSTCEMITEILQYMVDKVKLRPLEADALFAGITVDTKNFSIKTGVRTFEAAAFLRRHGADSTRVKMFFQNDMASYRARASAVKDAEIYRDDIAISLCPSDIPNPALTAAQAADELLNISGITASFVMSSMDHQVLMSARSLGDINVQLIMEKLGGGGHLTVAGAQFKNTTVDEVRQQLKQAIKEYLEEENRG
ncbi:MAG: phosphoesterase [Epulopiscium sp.]|nr:phosphoesterase [Candidatus Epulonipiscium sp.]